MGVLYWADMVIETVWPKNGTDFSLKELQDLVGGHIEVIWLGSSKLMIVNEKGKLFGLPYNGLATILYRKFCFTNDFIVGDALYCDEREVI